MKTLAASLFAFLSLAGVRGFHVQPSHSHQSPSALRMGFFDQLFSKPVHGHPGRLKEEDLDALYKDQQVLKKERQAHHVDKPHLKQKYARKKENWLEQMLHPIHGSGSATEEDLDDIYKQQQALLYMRREYGKSKSLLKKKYWHKSPSQQEAQRHVENVAWEKTHKKDDPKLLNQKEDDAMYIDEDAASNPLLNLKMPWDNLKP